MCQANASANIIENIVTTVSHSIQVLKRSWSIDIFKRRLGYFLFIYFFSIYGKLFNLQYYDFLLPWEIKLVHRVYQTRLILLQPTLQRKIRLRFCPRQNDTNLMASFCSRALAELVTQGLTAHKFL